MKTKITLSIIALIISFNQSISFAQTKSYKGGSVWDVSFVKVKANMSVEYLNSLKGTWTATQEEAIKQGLVVSYKILDGKSTSPEDWDIMLMVEYKNLAAMEGNDEKWDDIRKKIIGGDDALKAINTSRINIRDIYGSKILREVVYK
jgi:hypothetical protein